MHKILSRRHGAKTYQHLTSYNKNMENIEKESSTIVSGSCEVEVDDNDYSGKLFTCRHIIV